MDEQDKERSWRRYKRAERHMVGRDEELRRKAEARRRRAHRGRDAPRSRDVDDGETFAKIKRTRDDRRRQEARDLTGLPRAVVDAVHRGRVCLDDGQEARLAGRLAADPEFDLAVGDEVAFSTTAGPARIEARLPRRSVLARRDPSHPARELVLAANVDVGVIVVAAKEPPLRPGLVDRVLLALVRGGVAPLLCVNKVDLLATPAERGDLDRALGPYHELGVPVCACSAASWRGIDDLRRHVTGKTCVFTGHSGVGKSSLLNGLDPDGMRSVGSVRTGDGRGRHTTTGSSLRTLADGTRVIDTPGVREFGLDRLDRSDVEAGFPEIAAVARACRHGDCTHVHEPMCAVREAVERGTLPAARLASYLRIVGAGGDDAD